MLPILGRRECEHKSQWTSIQSLVPHNIVSFLNPFQNFHVQKLNKTKTCLPFQNNYVLKSTKRDIFISWNHVSVLVLPIANLMWPSLLFIWSCCLFVFSSCGAFLLLAKYAENRIISQLSQNLILRLRIRLTKYCKPQILGTRSVPVTKDNLHL